MESTVTIPLWEYKLMEKRIERKKDEVIYFYSGYYYGTKKQKELLETSDNACKKAQEELREIKKHFDCKITENEPSEVITSYKKAITRLYFTIWVLIATIIIILLI